MIGPIQQLGFAFDCSSAAKFLGAVWRHHPRAVMSVLIVIAETYGTSFAYVCVRDQAIHAPDCLSIPLTIVGSTLFDLVFQAGHYHTA